jgi:hypothetical protein
VTLANGCGCFSRGIAESNFDKNSFHPSKPSSLMLS